MKKIQNRLIIPGLLSILFVTALAGAGFGQNFDVVISKNTVESADTPPIPLAERDGKKIGRVPFQKAVTVNLNGNGANITAMQIPAGKRFVIENVTAIVRCLESQRIEVNYFTSMPDGGVAKTTVHKLLLQKQGSFNESAVFVANQKEIVYSDEKIGNEHFSVGVSAQLNGIASGFVQAQFTFSGYLEDLPVVAMG